MTTQVQAVGATTAAANPASVAATIGASVAGNFLFCVVIAIGAGSPTISTPAGFTQVFTTGTTTIKQSVFVQANNAGGVTTVTANLTNSTGAAIFVVELSGVPKAVLEFLSCVGGAGNGSGYGSIVTNVPAVSMYLEHWFVALGHNTAQAQSTSPAAAFTQIGGTQISTVGSPALEARLYTADISSLSWAIPSATLAGATDNTSTFTRMVGDQSVSGGIGAYGANVVNGYCGAGGGGPG